MRIFEASGAAVSTRAVFRGAVSGPGPSIRTGRRQLGQEAFPALPSWASLTTNMKPQEQRN
jgi:hypothetical protein